MRRASPRRADGKRAGRVVLPQWNSDAEGHIGLSRLLARFGVSALRLSLPYHDARMPPRADARRLHRQRERRADGAGVPAGGARCAARGRVAALQGYERIGILGTSLGSCLALLTSAHEPRIRAQALNHVSPWFADVVWRGLSTRHVRESLDGNITLDELRDLWRPINPWSYLDRIRDTQTLLVYARYDLTFPVDLSRDPGRRVRAAEAAARSGGAAVRPLQHRRRAVQLPGRLRADQLSETEPVGLLVVGGWFRQQTTNDRPLTSGRQNMQLAEAERGE